MKKLSSTIPLFPLRGALLLPTGDLPLNIFEPRYISMVNYALKNNKLIGMIQTKGKDSEELCKMGCVGKITSLNKTPDKRYLINLTGLSRFSILNELKNAEDFRIFNVKYKTPDYNFNNFNKTLFDKKLFIEKVKLYFENKGLTVDWKSLERIEDIPLIVMISMVCPFDNDEKQMLLESKDVDILIKTIIALLEFSIKDRSNHETIN